jgi:hypothetical protein
LALNGSVEMVNALDQPELFVKDERLGSMITALDLDSRSPLVRSTTKVVNRRSSVNRFVTMRLYGPKSEALTGKWNPPPVKRMQ